MNAIGSMDPLGRPRRLIALVASVVTALVLITGSAWASPTGSERPFVDSGVVLHFAMLRRYLHADRALAVGEPGVFYVDNHLRPYTGKHVVRKGWRIQDKRVRPGVSDYYVHDEDGRPLFRIDVPSHDSLPHWNGPIPEPGSGSRR